MHHPDYQEISHRFRHTVKWSDAIPLTFDAVGVDLFDLLFESGHNQYLLGHSGYRCEEHCLDFPGEATVASPEDSCIERNMRFRYPLVREALHGKMPTRHRHALILLHGLNERSFSKYIPWAYHLWHSLSIPVVMFPLTFHINRVSPTWASDQMANLVSRRAIPGNQNVHRFNAVISDRLGNHPERFLWGAIQSFWDIADFVKQVRRGEHAHFEPDTVFDLVGFSAGGYVALTMLLDDPDGLFSDSRCVVFSSGAMVRDVNLSSYLIVDQAAEIALMNMYVKHRQKLCNPRLLHWMDHHHEGQWFNCFCGLMPDRRRLDPRLRAIASRVIAIANTNDLVFPSGAVHNVMQGVHRDIPIRVEELDLGIHENPFAIPSYEWSDRRVITELFNAELFGNEFERFIDHIASFCARPI